MLSKQLKRQKTAQPNNIWQKSDVQHTRLHHPNNWCDWATLEGVLWPKKENTFEVLYFLKKQHPHQKTFQIKAKYHTSPSLWTNYNTTSSDTLPSWGFFITGKYICQHKVNICLSSLIILTITTLGDNTSKKNLFSSIKSCSSFLCLISNLSYPLVVPLKVCLKGPQKQTHIIQEGEKYV